MAPAFVVRRLAVSATLCHLCLFGCSSDSSTNSKAPTTVFTDAELAEQKCQLDGEVTAYVADATSSSLVEAAAGGKGIVACYQELGIGGAEPWVVIDAEGTVTYAPVFTAEGAGLYRSSDNGKTWSTTVPKFPAGGTHGRQQPTLFMDRETDEIFFSTTAASFLGGPDTSSSPATGGYDMTRSSDGYRSFEYSNVALEASDWMKMFAGPPVTSRTIGYPDVLYMSAPSPISTLAGVYQAVYKSLDGGANWTPVGGQQLSLKPADYPDCPTDPVPWIIFGNGRVGPDGTVYISLHRCGRLAVAVSQDEGETWTVRDVPGTSLLQFIGLAQMISRANALLTEPMAIDRDGTLYMVWPDEPGLLRLSVSRDEAQTWSAPVVVSEPSVAYAVYGGSAVEEPGTLAIAYYGSEVGEGGPFQAYMAESTNALSGEPEFRSARMNPIDAPLSPDVFDVGYARLFAGGTELNEIVKPEYAPNGDIWAAFARDMCPGHGAWDAATCAWDPAAHVESNWQAAVGRLVHR